MRDLYLGVDIGTSSSKGVLADSSGRLVARAAREHETSMPRPGWYEHDAESSWWGDFQFICHQLLAQTGERVAAVGVSGIGPCLLPIDDHFNPLRPAILYGVDTRAAVEIREIEDRYGKDTVLQRCGSPLTSQAVGPKLAWLHRHEPEVWQRMTRFVTASSYLVGKLTGEYVLDHHTASQCVPLYDLEHGCWIEEWADDLAPGIELPRLAWPGEVAGQITAEAASQTGLIAGTPVITGTVDAWSEALSVGVTRPGDVMLMYGTTMFIVAVVGSTPRDPRLWGTRGVFPGSYTAAAGMATSGALTTWLGGVAGAPTFEMLLQEAAATAAGADGLVALPYFAGERTPLFDERARGAVIGLTIRHTRGHLYRALLEATAYGVRHNLEAMAEAGISVKRTVAVGGGTRGSLWTQIVSDVCGLVQELPEEGAGASYGDALLAALATGAVADPSAWIRPAACVVPDSSNDEVYAQLYAIYRDLYPATRELTHRLADLQSSPAGGRGDHFPPSVRDGGEIPIANLGVK